MDTLENYLQEIASKNKVLLSPQDPICALHTILAKYDADMKSSFSEIFQDFASRLELGYKKSSDLTTEQLRKLLEAALGAARADASATYKESSEKLVATFSVVMDERLAKAEKARTSLYYVAMANALCAVCLVVTSLFQLLK